MREEILSFLNQEGSYHVSLVIAERFSLVGLMCIASEVKLDVMEYNTMTCVFPSIIMGTLILICFLMIDIMSLFYRLIYYLGISFKSLFHKAGLDLDLELALLPLWLQSSCSKSSSWQA